MDTVIKFILIFGALVFFHELGHLLFAKRAGILCREFAIGFGPKVFSFKKGETNYTIRLLPIGGFVMMAGEDPEKMELKPGDTVGLLFNQNQEVHSIVLNQKEKYSDLKMITIEDSDLEHQMVLKGYDEDDHFDSYRVSKESYFIQDGKKIQIAPYDRQFASKSVLDRFLTIFAGPAFNFILAFLILVVVGLLAGKPIDEAQIGKVIQNGPAYEAGLKQGDKIEAVNGQSVSTWEQFTQIVRENPKKPIDLVIKRDGETKQLTVTPEARKNEKKETEGAIQVYRPTEFSASYSLKYGITETVNWTKLIVFSVGDLVTGKIGLDQLSGPVGIYNVTDQVAQLGTIILLRWAAILSLNLGIFNLLPVPALDGGRLMFIIFEAIRGKPIDKSKEGLFHFVGFALLMLLMIVVTWNDIQKFFL